MCPCAFGWGALFRSLSDTGASEREDDEMNGILWKDPSSDSQHVRNAYIFQGIFWES